MANDRRRRRLLYVIVAGAIFAVGGVLSFVVLQQFRASDMASPAVSGPSRWSVEDARRFEEFPVYWLGESFEGLPLMRVMRVVYPGSPYASYDNSQDRVSFIYGDCTIPPGTTGCPVPLTIHITPYCKVPPEIIADAVKTGPPEEIREAMAQRTGKSSMRVWTGNVSIGISATDEALLDQVAQNLVRLNGDKPSSPEEALGPPDQIECPPQPWMMPGEHATETTTECYRNGTPVPCP